MKYLLAALVAVSGIQTAEAQLNYPARISTYGTGKVELTLIVDGGISNGRGECIFQIGQTNRLLLNRTLQFKPHGAMVKAVQLESGDAELFIQCHPHAMVYVQVLESTGGGGVPVSVNTANEKLFDTAKVGPFHFSKNGGFYKKLVIE